MSCGCRGCVDREVDIRLERLENGLHYVEYYYVKEDIVDDLKERVAQLEARLEEAVKHIKKLEGVPEEDSSTDDGTSTDSATEREPFTVPDYVLSSITIAAEDDPPTEEEP